MEYYTLRIYSSFDHFLIDSIFFFPRLVYFCSSSTW